MGSDVALLAEGVDRNNIKTVDLPVTKGSPSSRRAWIEMVLVLSPARSRASPSSRRAWIEIVMSSYSRAKRKGRPPRGGRG